MKAPAKFRYYTEKQRGFSMCFACGKWKKGNNIFYHDETHFVLCINDYFDYWENTDELLPDYKAYV
jgi:hypothetical protein